MKLTFFLCKLKRRLILTLYTRTTIVVEFCAKIAVFKCTFSLYSCTIHHQLHSETRRVVISSICRALLGGLR